VRASSTASAPSQHAEGFDHRGRRGLAGAWRTELPGGAAIVAAQEVRVDAAHVDRGDAQPLPFAQRQQVAIAQGEAEVARVHQMGRIETGRCGDPQTAGAGAQAAEKMHAERRGDAYRTLQPLGHERLHRSAQERPPSSRRRARMRMSSGTSKTIASRTRRPGCAVRRGVVTMVNPRRMG